MREYKRLTNNSLEEYDPEYDFCVGCKYFGEPNGCNRPNGTCDNYERFIETYNRLAELEDKIESGELISPNDVGNNEIEFFVKHNADVRKETAKEILQRVVNICIKEEDFQGGTVNTQLEPLYFGIVNGCDFIKDKVKEPAKEYGVEVEK